MSEDTNDQTAGQPKAWESDTGHDAAVPEDPAQAIALPAVTPPVAPANEAPAPPTPTPATPFAAAPQQPQPETTPPQGTPPSGSYAMGALGGNPALGATPGAAPSDPGTWSWPAQSAPPAGQAGAAGAKTGSHKVRTGVLIGGAAAVLLAAGIGIGHAAWSNNNSNLSALSSGNSFQVPNHTGSGHGSGSGNSNSGNPFGNVPGFNGGSSGGSGNSGSSNSGSSGPSDVNAIASKVDPGLVDINTTLGYQQEQAAGTGIVISSGGVILTNNHVIDGATTISVTDIGNGKTYTASVVGYDRTKDIAVLQLHNASGLTTANLADSSTASVGQQVVGVGNAGGTGGTPSAAGGTVTALNQSITASDEGDGTSEQLAGLIETNADIQPGDSGGALVNTSGQVLGVDTAASAGFSFQSNDQSSGTQGFAIPINTALSIARQIVAGNALVDRPHRDHRLPRRRGQPGGLLELGVREQRLRRRWLRRPLRGQQREHGQHRQLGQLGQHRRRLVEHRRRPDRRCGHQWSGPRGWSRPGRHHHLGQRQDHQLGERPHQRPECVPPGRQGDHRLDRLLGPEPHVERAAELGPAPVGAPPSSIGRYLRTERAGRVPGRLVVRLLGLDDPDPRDDQGQHRGRHDGDQSRPDAGSGMAGHLLLDSDEVVGGDTHRSQRCQQGECGEQPVFGKEQQPTEDQDDRPGDEGDPPVGMDQGDDRRVRAVHRGADAVRAERDGGRDPTADRPVHEGDADHNEPKPPRLKFP